MKSRGALAAALVIAGVVGAGVLTLLVGGRAHGCRHDTLLFGATMLKAAIGFGFALISDFCVFQ